MAKIELLSNGNLKITIPMSLRTCGSRKRIIVGTESIIEDDPITVQLARAFHWQKLIDNGAFINVQELANALGLDKGYVCRIIRLTLLAPEIVSLLVNGTMPAAVSLSKLRQPMPELWDEQKIELGITREHEPEN